MQSKRKPTHHRIRQCFIDAQFIFEGQDKSTEFLAAYVADRLGIDPGDVLAALGDSGVWSPEGPTDDQSVGS